MSVIAGVSVAHDVASVDAIERAAADDVVARVEDLTREPPVEEAFAIQTCNRAEAYVVTESPESGREVLRDALASVDDDAVEELGHEESLRHLLRVAAGLESLVLGEDQILGQLRDAYERARGVGALGPVLEEGITKAIHVGERARTETAINEGTVSLGSAAVELADAEYGLDGAVTLVVGAGEMGTNAARSFAVEGVAEVIVANRTVPHAEHVAGELDVDARATGLDDLAAAAGDADVLVSATGSQDPVIERETLAGAGETFVIDIAQPRDVAPAAGSLESVVHHDLDSLETITERTRRRRRDAAEEVGDMVDEEFERLVERYKRRRADDVIAGMYEGAEFVKRREVSEAVRKLEEHGDLTDDQREVVESMADALVGQLLAAPTRSLREAAAEDDWTTINTALRLFDPEFGAEDVMPDEIDVPDTARGAGDDD